MVADGSSHCLWHWEEVNGRELPGVVVELPSQSPIRANHRPSSWPTASSRPPLDILSLPWTEEIDTMKGMMMAGRLSLLMRYSRMRTGTSFVSCVLFVLSTKIYVLSTASYVLFRCRQKVLFTPSGIKSMTRCCCCFCCVYKFLFLCELGSLL